MIIKLFRLILIYLQKDNDEIDINNTIGYGRHWI
jgi:hypothetical protein